MPEIIDFDAQPTAIDGLLLPHHEAGRRTSAARCGSSTGSPPSRRPACRRSGPWRQVNVTETHRGAVRGMHAEDMVKLVAVVAGEAFAAYVDLRPASGTYGKVVTTTLAPGVARCSCPRAWATASRPRPRAAASTCTASTTSGRPAWPASRARPLDPALGIDWPLPIDPDDPSQVSAKDRDAPLLSELDRR